MDDTAFAPPTCNLSSLISDLSGSTTPAAQRSPGATEGYKEMLLAKETANAVGEQRSAEVSDHEDVECCDLRSRAVLYQTSQNELDLMSILKILRSPIQALISTGPPSSPIGGSIYLYPAEIDKATRRADRYNWVTDGAAVLPRSTKLVKKHYFYLRLANGSKTKNFRKYEFELPYATSDMQSYILVHYLGDHSLAGGALYHGNASKRKMPYVRSSGEVKRAIQSAGLEKSPMKVYRKLVTEIKCTGDAEAVAKPRNVEQVRNIQKQHRRQFRIGHDGLFNCVEIACQFPDFVHYIQVHPNLVIHLVNKSLLNEVDKIMKLSGKVEKIRGAEIQYDTTFSLGDFYVSVFSFRHPLFQGEPVVPVAFMVHERKFKRDHVKFMEYLAGLCSALSLPGIAIVTDCEFDFSSTFPNAVVAHCWNHIRRDVRFWLSKHGATSDDVRVYSGQVNEFLTAESEEEFLSKYNTVSVDWSAAFKAYFDKETKPNIEHHAGRWVLEGSGIYNPYSGVTTNPSESLNKVLKDLLSWKERPVDAVLVSFKYLLGFYERELMRGQHGLGNYVLKPEFKIFQQPSDLLPTSEATKCPEDIVEYIRSGLEDVEIPETISSTAKRQSDSGKKTSQSQEVLAKNAVEESKVVFVPHLKAFLVEGSNGCKYAVTLFPKEKCQCSSTGTCYHIISAKILMGIPVTPKRKQLNLSQLRKPRLKKGQKRSGRKVPRAGDYEVLPAPDSESIQHESLRKSDTDNVPTKSSGDPNAPEQFVPPAVLSSHLTGSHLATIIGTLKKRLAAKLKSCEIIKPDSQNQLSHSDQNDVCVISVKNQVAVLVNRTLNPAKPVVTVYTFNANLSEDDLLIYHSACFATTTVFTKSVKVIIETHSSQSDMVPFLTAILSARVEKKPTTVVEHQIRIRCLCRKPYIESLSVESLILCHSQNPSSRCLLSYHRSCLSESLPDVRSDTWICPQCSIPTGLPGWGSTELVRAVNTCSFDNLLVAVFIHSLEVTEPFLEVFKDGPPYKALGHSIRLMQLGNHDCGKETWMQFLSQKSRIPFLNQGGSKTLDFYGNEYEMFIQHFSDSWTVTETTKCSSTHCPNPQSSRTRNSFTASSLQDISALEKMFSEPQTRTCSEKFLVTPAASAQSYLNPVRDEKSGEEVMAAYCAAQRTCGPSGFTNPEHVWMIPLYVGGSGNLAEAMNFPPQLDLCGLSFMLRAITMHSSASSHFSAVIRWKGLWFCYDGLVQERLTWFMADSPGLKELKPNYVLYMRN